VIGVTTILVAALVLAWAAIVLLTLGYAGLVAQIRELQSRSVAQAPSVYPDLAAPSPDTRTVVLLLSTSCDTCAEVFHDWLELARQLTAAGHRAAVVSVDGSRVWAQRGATDVLLAADLSAPLLVAYQPAVLLFDHRGAVVSAEPIGSAAGLHDACAPLLDPEPALVGR